MILVRPPNRPSNSAWSLRRELGNIARLSRRNPVLRRYTHIINWGNSSPLTVYTHQKVLNNPDNVRVAVDKLEAFTKLKEGNINVPYHTTVLPADRNGIYLARTLLRASGGDGIHVVRPGDEVPSAPLYVKYIPKTKEYRVHVVDGKVIFVQRKRRPHGAEQDRDQRLIRNHTNGWIFALLNDEDANLDHIEQEAVNAVQVLGLDFGAVDIIEGRDDGKAYVLEVNTCVGIRSPSVLEAYASSFRAIVEQT